MFVPTTPNPPHTSLLNGPGRVNNGERGEYISNAEKAKIVNDIFGWRLEGADYKEVEAKLKANGYNLKHDRVVKFTRVADRRIKRQFDTNQDELFGFHIALRRQVIAGALEQNDYRTVLIAAKDEAELANLYPAKKVDVSGQIIQLIINEQIVTERQGEIEVRPVITSGSTESIAETCIEPNDSASDVSSVGCPINSLGNANEAHTESNNAAQPASQAASTEDSTSGGTANSESAASISPNESPEAASTEASKPGG